MIRSQQQWEDAGTDIPGSEHGMCKCPETGTGLDREAGVIRGLENEEKGKHGK